MQDPLDHSLSPTASTVTEGRTFGSLVAAHVAIARFDHWVKNVFVLPGIVLGLTVESFPGWPETLARSLVGLLAAGLVASSNYVLNEVLDAPYDKGHPTKRFRPVPSGKVLIPLAYVQWILLMLAGVGLGARLSLTLAGMLVALWVMGIVYNVRPIRSKELPYIDVMSEAVNNPLRLLIGWYVLPHLAPPPISLLASYWMVGCYFMAIKRYAEYREIGNRAVSSAYRSSFSYYNEPRLLVSIMFYAAAAMLMFGAFIVRYRLEWILSAPLVSLVMALYLQLAFQENSAAQNPESLYKQPKLIAVAGLCAVVMVIFLFVDVPWLRDFFAPLEFSLQPMGLP